MSGWTFLTHHAHVLLCIARDPDVRLREVAAAVGITERAVQTIVNDLADDGYVVRRRVGRRNHYEIVPDVMLRHPLQRDVGVGRLVELMQPPPARPNASLAASQQPELERQHSRERRGAGDHDDRS